MTINDKNMKFMTLKIIKSQFKLNFRFIYTQQVKTSSDPHKGNKCC